MVAHPVSPRPIQRGAIEPPPLREILMPSGYTRKVIYDAMTDQTGVRANGETFGLRFRVLAVSPK